MRRMLTCCWVALLACSCATVRDDRAPTADHVDGDVAFLTVFDRPSVTAFWIPGLAISPDEDSTESDGGREFDADLDTGDGWGVRVNGGSDGGGLGLLYMTTSHEERESDSRVRTHSAYLEYLTRLVESGGDGIGFHIGVAAGVGGAAFDFNEAFDDTGGAAGLARIEVGAGTNRLRLTLGGGGFIWGYPGETIGSGAFATIGLTLRF